jgi:formylglycine-generating enzyme required for sulfatase activity
MVRLVWLAATAVLAAAPLRYEAWLAAHPDAAAEIAALKTRTAELVAEAGLGPPTPEDPNLAVTPAAPAAPDPRVELAPVILSVAGAIAEILDCAEVCPELVVAPAGEFTMGAPAAETGRTPDEAQARRSLDRPLAVGRYEVTRGQYAAFVDATGRPTETGCPTDRVTPGTWADDPLASWRDPGFAQTDDDPVVCVSWDEAAAYAAWLAARTGLAYRLLTEAEFEYVARAGAAATYGWGEAADDACGFANGRDAAFARAYRSDRPPLGCDDGFVHTAPVGSFQANGFGLFDTAGNVWEWTSTCLGGCVRRIQRGGGWGAGAVDLRPAQRVAVPTASRDASPGFRVAREL